MPNTYSVGVAKSKIVVFAVIDEWVCLVPYDLYIYFEPCAGLGEAALKPCALSQLLYLRGRGGFCIFMGLCDGIFFIGPVISHSLLSFSIRVLMATEILEWS